MNLNLAKANFTFFQKQNFDYLKLLPVLLSYIFLILLWHHYNNYLPKSDAAGYMNDIFLRYHKFIDKGFIAGIEGLYFDRGWRPQAFPIFGVPFLILFGKSPFNAYVGVSVTFGSLLLIYLFLILRVRLSFLYSAILSFFIATSLIIFCNNLLFFSEVAYMPLVLATFYHLIRSEYFSVKKHSMLSGIFAGLITFIRPAEAIMFLSVALLPFVIVGFKRRNFEIKDILLSINLALATVLSLLYITYLLPAKRLKYYLALVALVFLIKKFREFYSKNNNCFIIFVISTLLMVLTYWLPSVASLMEWSIAASVGDVVKSLQVQDKSIFSFAHDITSAWTFILCPLLLAVPIILLKNNYKRINRSSLILALAALIPLMLLVINYKLAVNDNQIIRRSLGMGLLLTVAISTILFDKEIKFKAFSLIPIILVTLFNVSTILIYSLDGKNNSLKTQLAKITSLYPEPFQKDRLLVKPGIHKIDPAIVIANLIDRNICKYDVKNCLNHHRSFFIAGPIFSEFDSLIDPFSAGFASTRMNGNESKFHLGAVFVPVERDFYDVMKEKNVGFVIVQDHSKITQTMLDRKDVPNSYLFTADLIKSHRNGDKFKKLKLIDTVKIYDSEVLILRNPSVPLN